MKISHELKMKILENKQLLYTVTKYREIINSSGFKVSYPLCKESKFIIDLHNELQLLEECVNWINLMKADMLYIDTPQVNVGCFKGIFPVEINSDDIITFIYHIMDPNGESWKDWFIMEEEDAS